MSKVKPVGVGNIDAKMEMLQATFITCIEKFHEPTSFVAQVDATIQALRNFTFTIQNNKSFIPDFETWYEPWQRRLGSDPYLKWLNSIRIDVVHKDILTTTSNATVSLINDHTERIVTKHFNIMSSTKELVENGVALAKEVPFLRHATGIIERHYLFEVAGTNESVLDVLGAGLAAMSLIYSDLSNYIHKGGVIKGDLLPELKGRFTYPPEKLKITFKLRDGAVFSEAETSISRQEMLEGGNLAKEHYGEFKSVHKLNSKNKMEVLRAHFEIAKTIFNKDGHHIPVLQIKGKRGRYMIVPEFHDRAEKMYFMERFAKRVHDEGITEIIFTIESWVLTDPRKVGKQLKEGKEISALRNKGEVLEVLYLDKKGTVLGIHAPIIRDKESGVVKLGKPQEQKISVSSYPIFFPVFFEWGLIERATFKSSTETEKTNE